MLQCMFLKHFLAFSLDIVLCDTIQNPIFSRCVQTFSGFCYGLLHNICMYMCVCYRFLLFDVAGF